MDPPEHPPGADDGAVLRSAIASARADMADADGGSPVEGTRGHGPSGADAPRSRVLVVDDEPYISDLVSMALRHEGFDVQTAATGREALRAVGDFRPDLLLLDVMLPDMSGFDVAERLGNQHVDVPIIFLSARDSTDDKVHGLTIGGDDYVTKPFSLEEVLARVRTLLKRSRGVAADAERLRFSDLELDESTREVWRAGKEIELTDTEYRLVRYLMQNPRRVLTRAQLLDHVWRYDFTGDARVLETYVSYVRKKLEAHGPRLVHTMRGVGYTLREPREPGPHPSHHEEDMAGTSEARGRP